MKESCLMSDCECWYVVVYRRDLSKIQEEQIAILRKLERERRREQQLMDHAEVCAIAT